MARFAIVTSHLTSGDAVSNDVVKMQQVLENHGYEARLYAGSVILKSPKCGHWARSQTFSKLPMMF